MPIAEGKKLDFLSEDAIDSSALETFPYEGPRQLITYETNEFSAVCPFSGLPDIAYVKIDFIPKKKIVELKSLKYYFLSYRQVGIYQEPATARIFEDLKKCLEPEELSVTMKYNTRGGIDAQTVVSSKNQ